MLRVSKKIFFENYYVFSFLCVVFSMVRSLIRKDIPSVKSCVVLPMATGMGVFMALTTLRERRPEVCIQIQNLFF